MRLAPIGALGELCVGGIGVGRGYLYDEERTAQAFTRDPFTDGSPSRLYKTGDLARFLADGKIEFAGRKDYQVKVRGLRIELGEIEAALRSDKKVREAVVVVREYSPGDKRLVAYVVTSEGASLQAGELRSRLQDLLPEYMAPASIIILPSLPLTSNGKVNRRALPAPDPADDQRSSAFEPPETETERVLSTIWAEALGRPRVGRADNFFDLGGHSLLVTRVISQARRAFAVHLPLRALFDAPTLADLAGMIDVARQGDQIPRHAPAPPDLSIEAVLDQAIRPASTYRAPNRAPEKAFLTGATGFLGAFLLYELLSQTDMTIHCLARSQDVEVARQKIRRNLENYGLWREELGSRIVPLPGDLSQPLLGLSEGQFESLAASADVIYHSAAALNAVLPYASLKPTNVNGVREVLRLACQVKVKPLHYISTTDVLRAADLSPGSDENVRVRMEQDGLNHWRRLSEGYAQSKWVAEKLVMAARDRGLPVCIYRPATLSGHSQLGLWNTNDTLCRMIKGCIELRAAPGAESEDRDGADRLCQ